MSDREYAAFAALAALIFPAFAPVDLESGRIVATVGFIGFSAIAGFLFYRNRRP